MDRAHPARASGAKADSVGARLMAQLKGFVAALMLTFLFTSACGAVMLDGSKASVEIRASLVFLLDPNNQLTADAVEALPETAFAAVNANQDHLLGNGAMWLRFDAAKLQSETHWRVVVPLPGVDDVSLYYRQPDGQWMVQRAGDRRAISSWAQPARYPVFTTANGSGQAVRYLVKIEHARVPYSVMPRLMTDAQLLTTELSDHILLGAYFGLAALVVVLALANMLAYRDAGFGTYALYVALFTVSQAMFTGVAGLYWWPETPQLNRSITFVITLAIAAGVWFVRTVVMPKRFSRLLDVTLLALIALLPLVGLIDMVWYTQQTFKAFNLLITTGLAVLLVVVFGAAFKGQAHSRWIACGLLPVLLATLLPLMRNFGVIQSSFWTEYALLIGSAIEVPILFYGLHHRMALERGINIRASRLLYADPLTGVYNATIVTEKLQRLFATAPRHHHPFALLAIDLANYGELQKKYNRDTAERALVMAAARIRTAAGSMDTVARMGETRFGLLLEGPVSAREANEVATKILAAGLRATHELPQRDSLRFHIVVGHHSQPGASFPAQAEFGIAQLLVALADMNDGSGRAIKTVQI